MLSDTTHPSPHPHSTQTAASGAHPHAGMTFEAGMRDMKAKLETAFRVEQFYARTEDPLHQAFGAKAALHSGPGGMPLMGEAAQAALAEHLNMTYPGKRLAYIHVPFCETRCLYCLFYQNPFREDWSHHFTDSLIAELALWADHPIQNASPIHALYFGGGTPTALSSEDLTRILKAVKQYLPLANDCEITLEGRIHNLTEDRMEAAIAGGVNRFSLGVQTFNDEVRQMQRRIDGKDVILDRLDRLIRYDEAAVVIDLIYGFPKQTMEVWQSDLEIAASLPLDGIDCYQLNVFEKAPMAKFIQNGKMPPAADTAMKADMFAMSVEYLTRANWRRLSNNHWGQGTRERNIYNQLGKSAVDCLAFGSGAGGRINGYSFMLERQLDRWHEMVAQKQKPVTFLTRPSAHWHLMKTISSEMESGAINMHRLAQRFETPIEPIARPLLEQWGDAGLLVKHGDWYHHTVAGQFWHVTMAQLLVMYLQKQLQAPL